MFRHPAVRRPVAGLLLVLMLVQTTGCGSGWKPVTTPTPEVGTSEPGTVFRYRLPSGELVALRDPVVRGDSIVGVRWSPGAHFVGDSTRTIPRTGAELLGWRKAGSGGKTEVGVGLALLGLVAALAVAAEAWELGPILR